MASFVLVAATLLIGLVTLRATTGSPDLEVRAVFPFNDATDRLRFLSTRSDRDQLVVVPFKQIYGRFIVQNRSPYSARGVSVRVEFINCSGIEPTDGWVELHRISTYGLSQMQWDGGSNFNVQGHWSRHLPLLDFSGLQQFGEGSALRVTVTADGTRPRESTIPIYFTLGPL
ncbi:hypothetical protein [Allobranchiibius sp. GilTou73]|uniref:hypothetical protein n=1 Tax=Allobranchiibius sp. GilTou73 TaxID=2904523 RepID=UPI001F26A8F5|nr:hypothetical protein [Allobranchiibius sp. GilTou73]UIJ35123.1 hypothetical protein LVQ62_01555 [Allobranchiibius sp. GilTou73]